jgi:flagellin-specific chaperone FliS
MSLYINTDELEIDLKKLKDLKPDHIVMEIGYAASLDANEKDESFEKIIDIINELIWVYREEARKQIINIYRGCI